MVDLAAFNMSEDTLVTVPHLPVAGGITHNSARFIIQLWVDGDNGVHVELMQPKSHGKFLPCNSVLSCLSDFCHNCMSSDSDSGNGVTQVIGVTEVTVNNIHICASPSGNGVPWHDNIVIGDDANEHRISVTTCAKVQFLFCFPGNPNEYFAVIHPAYAYQPQ